jgi:5-methylcytosine-specific restriction endonuclease McrA
MQVSKVIPMSERIELHCKICGKVMFLTEAAIKDGRGHYCSRECASKGRTKFGTRTTKCAYCGIEFTYAKSKDREFCSRRCSGLAHQQLEMRICPQCGQEYMCRPGDKRRLCSRSCYADWRSQNIRGDKHPSWIGGVRVGEYPDDFDDTLKEMIRDRDGNRCAVCGKQYKKRLLPIHHIDYNKNNSNPNNLITLCNSCHAKTLFNRDHWSNFFPILMTATLSLRVKEYS